MNEYEITYLSETHLGEEDRKKMDDTIDKQIIDLGGAIMHTTPSLRVKLAYPIDKKPAAFTRTLHVELEPDKLDTLQIFFKKHKDIVRTMVVATPYRPGVKQDDSKQGEKESSAKKDTKPAKKVTMEDVEKGIETALEEEVK